jgi:site-specific recombinase XerD
MSNSNGHDGPSDLSPREALERFLDRKRIETSKQTIGTYHSRLRLFVEWAEDEQIAYVSELNGWLIDKYETARRARDIAPLTLNKEMGSLRRFIAFLYIHRTLLMTSSFYPLAVACSS